MCEMTPGFRVRVQDLSSQKVTKLGQNLQITEKCYCFLVFLTLFHPQFMF